MDNKDQANSDNNQFVNTQTNTGYTPTNTPIFSQNTTPIIPSDTIPQQPSKNTSNRTLIAVIVAIILIMVGVVATLFLTGVIGAHRVEVGDYTVIVDENNWSISIGQDGKTLVLMDKEDQLSGIGLLPYQDEITYETITQKGMLEDLFSNIKEYKMESQSEKIINNSKCVVVNIKYTNAVYASDKAIRAFCENKNKTIFLVEVEGSNQAKLDSNLNVGVEIINTAKHK